MKTIKKTKSNKIATLDDALVIKLKSLYDIEAELVKALPKMAKAATDPDLKKGFTDHLKETKNHVTRLDDAFKAIGIKAGKVKVEAIRGFVKDADWIVKQKPEKRVLDAQLIAAASYVEHYEIAGYIAAHRWSVELGLNNVADLLEATLAEEDAAAEKLATLGEQKVDEAAM